jgi:hypothetical protein
MDSYRDLVLGVYCIPTKEEWDRLAVVPNTYLECFICYDFDELRGSLRYRSLSDKPYDKIEVSFDYFVALYYDKIIPLRLEGYFDRSLYGDGFVVPTKMGDIIIKWDDSSNVYSYCERYDDERLNLRTMSDLISLVNLIGFKI